MLKLKVLYWKVLVGKVYKFLVGQTTLSKVTGIYKFIFFFSHARSVVATLGGQCGAASRHDKWRYLHAGFTVWLSISDAEGKTLITIIFLLSVTLLNSFFVHSYINTIEVCFKGFYLWQSSGIFIH